MPSQLGMGFLWIPRPAPWLWGPGVQSYYRTSNFWMRWATLIVSESQRELFMPREAEHLDTFRLHMMSLNTARPRYLTELAKEHLVLLDFPQLVCITIASFACRSTCINALVSHSSFFFAGELCDIALSYHQLVILLDSNHDFWPTYCFNRKGGESGSADTARDPRGFAMKFYTEEGNWDLVGNNTPIFFIRDPILVGFISLSLLCKEFYFNLILDWSH